MITPVRQSVGETHSVSPIQQAFQASWQSHQCEQIHEDPSKQALLEREKESKKNMLQFSGIKPGATNAGRGGYGRLGSAL